jgi:hypothetical protein
MAISIWLYPAISLPLSSMALMARYFYTYDPHAERKHAPFMRKQHQRYKAAELLFISV